VAGILVSKEVEKWDDESSYAVANKDQLPLLPVGAAQIRCVAQITFHQVMRYSDPQQNKPIPPRRKVGPTAQRQQDANGKANDCDEAETNYCPIMTPRILHRRAREDARFTTNKGDSFSCRPCVETTMLLSALEARITL
jgi:hypothetical protein